MPRRFFHCDRRSWHRSSSTLGLVTLGLCLLVGIGCENTIAPYAEKSAYSVQGYVNIADNQQFVRVKPLQVPLTKIDSNSVNATVTLENLGRDTVATLADSVFVFEDSGISILSHNYWTELPIPPRTRFQLTVDGPAGTVQSTAVTPTGTRPTVTPRKGACDREVSVVFREMTHTRRVRSWITVKPEGRGEHTFFQYDSPLRGYDFNTFRTEEGWLGMSFNPSKLMNNIPGLELPVVAREKDPRCWDVNPCTALETAKIEIWFMYLGPEWHGDLPPDSLTYDPLQSYDVEGGLGFFGGVFRDWERYTPNTSEFVFTGGHNCDQDPPAT